MRTATPATPLVALLLLLAPEAHGQTFLHKSLPDWRSDLKNHPKAAGRRSAAFALARMGSVAILSIPDLGDRLGDGDPGVREMAASAIGDIVRDARFPTASEWAKVNAGLLKSLDDDSPRVRRSAAYAVGSFGPAAAAATAPLRKAARDGDPAVRQNALWAIGRVAGEDALDVLTAGLTDDAALVRRDAASAIRETASRVGRKKAAAAAEGLFALVKKESDDVVLKTALSALTALADESHRGHADGMYVHLDAKDPVVVRDAAFALGNMGGEPAARAMNALRKSLTVGDPGTQALTAACLANAGADAAPLVKDIAALLKGSTNFDVRRNCAVALGQIADGVRKKGDAAVKIEDVARDCVDVLAEVVKPRAGLDRNAEEVRIYAAEALARLEFPYNSAAAETIKASLTKDGNTLVRQRCVWCLFKATGADIERLGLDKPLNDVLVGDDDANLMVRYDAARLLASAFREKASDRVVAVLLHMIANKSLRVFEGSSAAIKKTGDEAGGGASGVETSGGGDARYMAAMALGWMGEKSKKNDAVMLALKEAAKMAEKRLVEEAKRSLEALGE